MSNFLKHEADLFEGSCEDFKESCRRFEETANKTDNIISALDRIIASQNECLRLIEEIKRNRNKQCSIYE